jgi:hypothetical protein
MSGIDAFFTSSGQYSPTLRGRISLGASEGWKRLMAKAYFSEIKYDGPGSKDFIEVAVTEGTDVTGWSVVMYAADGTQNTSWSLGAVQSTTAGRDVYVTGGNEDIGGTRGYALVDDTGAVRQFISFTNNITAVEGPAAGMNAVQHGSVATGSQSAESTDGGNTYQTQASSSEGTITCFTPGTLILTPAGEVPVEHLQVGDLVVTRDHGNQPIRYVARSEVTGPDMPENRQPILIAQGSLGSDLPRRDLVVSGQHRMLLDWHEVREFHDTAEVLAPANGLEQMPGIRLKRGVRHVDYIHLLLDRHEVLFAEGAATESFYPGPTVLRDMKSTERDALFQAVPELRNGVVAALGEPARQLLRVQETKTLVKAHKCWLKANTKPLIVRSA